MIGPRTLLALALVAAVSLACAVAALLATGTQGRSGRASIAPATASASEREIADRTSLVAPEPEPAAAPEPARAAIVAPEPAKPDVEAQPFGDVRAARVAGRVLDADGAPVPDLDLRLRAALLGLVGDAESKWLTEQVVTDADGRFESVELFPAGRVTARSHGDGAPHVLARHEHLAGRSSCDWTVRMGAAPTFRLRIEGAGAIDPANWRARLAYVDEDGDERAWKWKPLAAGEPLPWIRYPARPSAGRTLRQPRIEVASRDGVWRGAAAVATATPDDPLVVAVEPEAVAAALSGSVVGSERQPLSGVAVALTRLDAGDAQEETVSATTDWEGSFAFAARAPGRYRLDVGVALPFALPTQTKSLALELGAGVTELEPLVLDQVAGDIWGTARCESGDTPRAALTLRPLDRPDSEPCVALADADGSFAFGNLPPGDYELSALPVRPGSFEALVEIVTPPLSDLELTVSACGGSRTVRLRAVDAQTGEPIGDFTASVCTDTVWEPQEEWSFGGGAVTLDVPLRGGFTWLLLADGYRPARGGPADLPADGSTLDVPLERGWAGVLRLRTRAPAPTIAQPMFDYQGMPLGGDPPLWTPLEPAVAGVEIRADGEPVARTDASGTAVISLPSSPSSISFPGWRITSSGDPLRALHRGPALFVVEPL